MNLPLLQLLAAFAGWGVWALRPSWGWPVALAAIPWGIGVARGHKPRLSALDAALLAFLLSALVGLWAGYDPHGARAIFSYPVGWQKLWGLLLALLAYAALAALRTPAQRRWGLGLLSGIGALAALLFVLGHDWDALPAEFAAITQVGRALQGGSPRLPGGGPNANVAAGAMAVGACAALALLGSTQVPAAPAEETHLHKTKRWSSQSAWRTWAWIALAAMAVGLALTTSRGALLGLGAAGLLAFNGYLAGTIRRDGTVRRAGRARRRTLTFALLVARDAALVALAWSLLPGLRAALLAHPDVQNRLWIFSRGLLVLRDFAFTGCGLGHFPLVDSTYAQLIHVPTLPYSHALLLDVAVEQGLLGALALALAWGVALWRGVWAVGGAGEGERGRGRGGERGGEEQLSAHRKSEIHPRHDAPGTLIENPKSEIHPVHDVPGALMGNPQSTILTAGLLALVATAVHSLVDDPFYASRWAVLLFAPLGMIASGLRDAPAPGRWQRRLGRAAPVALAAGAVALLFAARFSPLPAWYANLGAVAQAKAELPPYDYRRFDRPTLDAIRRAVDLSVAEAYYDLALALEPAQVTARTRLAGIALSRGEYDAALAHAEAAWRAGHGDRVTRMVLSDALVAHGEVALAAGVAYGLTWSEDRLLGQAHYRYRLGRDARRATYARHTAVLLARPAGR